MHIMIWIFNTAHKYIFIKLQFYNQPADGPLMSEDISIEHVYGHIYRHGVCVQTTSQVFQKVHA